ncbi:pyruvate phosphate dikinase PEP/pyruvate-binding protein [Desulfovibrio sp. X2]|uniref:PEP/pyruvate-binding domain-containing protein n=1 Tax=Desulfovibrio sp. X2 TaxID=941449 RepID=UPI0003587745|nr:PEP/pyruvate-binding domain-containing protein [Desulfovibrio sp. X2]EPR41584.1 pyruvate phosphate dikinase PEP/pyruvate-binding protein [Desulfovibrio sp. X2]
MFRRLFTSLSTLFDPAHRAASPARRKGREAAESLFRVKYRAFQELLASNSELLGLIAAMDELLTGSAVFGLAQVRSLAGRVAFHATRMVKSFERLSGRAQPELEAVLETVRSGLSACLQAGRPSWTQARPTIPHAEITREMVDDVGGKNANLGEVLCRVGLPVPAGFAVTTWAGRTFFATAGIDDVVASILLDLDVEDPAALALAGEEIQALVLRAPLPEEIDEALRAAHAALAEARGVLAQALRVSVRSSAVGEDGALSFAGQYVSLLNVDATRLAHAYKCVMASLYTPRAMAYRRLHGIPDEEPAMGVAVLPMVEARAGGVLYTRPPFGSEFDDVVIDAVWGLGAAVVDGKATPDQFTVARLPRRIVGRRTEFKQTMRVCDPAGGLRDVPVPPGLAGCPCLTDEQVLQLSDFGLRLESHYGCPQDVEWVLEEDGPGGPGRLLILQTRPLARVARPDASPDASPDVAPVQPPEAGAELLLSGGRCAVPGAAAGPVHHAAPDSLEGFPDGGVLVALHSSPKYLPLLRRAAAVVAEHGSVTGHMAALCREFAVPTLLGLPGACAALAEGAEITVDAAAGRVYAGRVQTLLARRGSARGGEGGEGGEETRGRAAPAMAGTPVHAMLRRAASLISPLNLLDPKAPSFAPAGCRTVHDVMRYLHEKSYTEMFALSDLTAGHAGLTARLDAATGLDLHLIDLGGALAGPDEGGAAPRRRRVAPGEVVSRPLRALLDGLVLTPEQQARPRPVHLGGFMAVMGQQMLAPPAANERFGDKSYAIASDKYLNFSSRVGYHYGVLDCYCGQTVNKNYITFAFSGGAADDAKRARRARAIGLIMERLGFEVERTGDRVFGRFQKFEPEVIEERLRAMGRLLQFTRQTDMLMVSEQSVQAMVECFLAGGCWFEPTRPSASPEGQDRAAADG